MQVRFNSLLFCFFLSFIVLLIPGKIKRLKARMQPETSVLMLDCCEENNAGCGRPDALKYLKTLSRRAAAASSRLIFCKHGQMTTNGSGLSLSPLEDPRRHYLSQLVIAEAATFV